MVTKPTEQTPLSALYCAHLAKLAGVPNGVFNVITGFGKTAGVAINHHMDIGKAAAKSNLKQVSLERGGKSPLVIFDDANINMAANLALLGILFNQTNAAANEL
ncbi:aldehyde dehydrogenase family 2 member C4-like [Pyrus ussuriensis x Pyrus communis]|uniref:Aldehyde dehydrogenase family 2 member C4-like n=1 Tax=Pyrus ussuriensis x Pyrus communis TaxID=2448454 RepID=A0A5N5HJY5_9ROSA|nr:aldehyde dehydrogenase family 2 member C4-like [Pyrus ussuriensis x Pyrus communis]KAB2626923.1 aldehyde dehydrogenase family 2 member C4-like [Pyrus ussuriensis x Pyrus communis]